MQSLPRDPRGYPIPWNVLVSPDGEPFFTINDDRRHNEALRLGLCPICGHPLGKWMWFVGGPKSAFDPHGWYLDLPGHHDCEQFALQVCPYLSAPRYIHEIGLAGRKPPATLLVDETVLPDRPEIFVTVASNKVEFLRREILAPYVRPGRPFLGFEIWRHGKQLPMEEGIMEVRRVLGEEWNPPEI